MTAEIKQIKPNLEWREKLGGALLDMENDFHLNYCGAALIEELYEKSFKKVDAQDHPAVRAYVERGYVVYILTKREDDVFGHAVYQAGDLARTVVRKFEEATGGGK